MAEFKDVSPNAPAAEKALNWIDNRFPLSKLFKEHMSEYYAPKNFNFLYFFGVLSMVVLVIQILTGVFLVMHYKPDAAQAFASVEYIMRDVPWGWLIRYMHSTGASAFFIVVYMHMFRGLIYGSYRKPRELVWLFGCAIFLALMGEAFMGYLLPWGQMSYWGAQVIVNLFSAIPFIGPDLALLIRGDYVVGDATLNRFFSFHVIAVPLVLLGLVAAHIIALHEVGSNNPDGVEIMREDAALGRLSDLGSSAGEVIARNGQHILGVVNDIIDAARVEAGEMSIARSPIDLRSIAHDAVQFLAARAAAKGIALRFEPGIRGPAAAISDPLRVRQILLNLIGNAVKFTEHGSVTVDMGISGSRWMISVRDTGPGMNEQEMALLFRRFSQTSTADTVNGSGLGLALSRQLAHMLGGDLVVQSVPGAGTTFTLTLPRTATPAEELITALPDQPGAGAAGDVAPLPLAGVQILVAEDGPDSARLCRHFLERAGAAVTVASDGRQALAFLRAAEAGVFDDPFDVVLMDMEMPVMDGMQAVRAIRAGGSQIPVIALTAHAGDDVRARCLAGGFSDYLAKPADRRTLLAAVAAWRPIREYSDHGTAVLPA